MKQDSALTRRRFLASTMGTVAAASLRRPASAQTAPATYTRYKVTSPGGQRALASYARGVEAMLTLPATHPHNWFRNAFVHILDCPHGNWWFYVWHRGYLGHFEQTIRRLSGDPTFAMPYWDWTAQPRVPAEMFGPFLTPTDGSFAPYTRNLDVFTRFIQPAVLSYWNSLNPQQLAQLNWRGYDSFARLWDDVNGVDPKSLPVDAIAGNIAYANPVGGRYLTPDNPAFDAKTAHNVSRHVLHSGLTAPHFYDSVGGRSFNSAKALSHNLPAGGKSTFSILEGLPHNQVHNYIGGVGPLDQGPYGYMTNFLSPVDPIFFLHHANMDRLWDVWTRSRMRMKLPWTPDPADEAAFMNEPFLFFVDGSGTHLTNGKAGDYFQIGAFNYVYEPGTGEEVVQRPSTMLTSAPARPGAVFTGALAGDRAAMSVPAAAIQAHLDPARDALLFAEVTIERPHLSWARSFDVLVGTSADLERADADTRHHVGTVSFFGHMSHARGAPMQATFVVPLPRQPEVFGSARLEGTPLHVRVLPSSRRPAAAPTLVRAAIHAR